MIRIPYIQAFYSRLTKNENENLLWSQSCAKIRINVREQENSAVSFSKLYIDDRKFESHFFSELNRDRPVEKSTEK